MFGHVDCGQPCMTRSSSGGVAISYVLPVLWMTSYFHIMDLRVMCIPDRPEDSVTAETSVSISVNGKRMERR